MSHAYLERLERALKEHEAWRLGECLNLIPSENRSSPLSRQVLTSDLGNRYTAPDKFYRGTRYLDEVQSISEEVARKVFNARYASVRALSGHMADMAVLLSLAARGDRILSVSPDNGGYEGITHLGFARVMGLKNLYFPYDVGAVNIDAQAANAQIASEKPRLVVFGASYIPFPHPTRELTRRHDGVSFVYDGSHVLGLMAGGEFQDPLREGCSLLFGSTHKSLPGPQGGIIVSNNDEVFAKVSSNLHMVVVDNIHLNRVASLAVTLMEMLQFGKPYARAVVKNAQRLARGLHERGVQVRGAALGFTKSHQVLLDYRPDRLTVLSERLERANIISDNGGRLGTSEATRLGYGPKEMDDAAELISMVVLGKKPTDVVKREVKSLVKNFREPKYVLKSLPGPLES